MLILILGLALFLGVHSLRIVAEPWRRDIIAERGEPRYKAVYSLVSALGLVLIVLGYGQSRSVPVFVWVPPPGLSHVTALLMLFSFVLLAAAYVPGTRLKAVVGHPMVLAVKIWAVAHLLSNGRLGDMVLFGAFLLWAVIDFSVSRRRDRRDGVVHATEPGFARDFAAVLAGIAAWIAFAFWLHRPLFGVSPLGV